MLVFWSVLAPLTEWVSPVLTPNSDPAPTLTPGMSDAVLQAILSPETLILALAGLLFSGCVFIALEIRAEYRDN